MRIFDNRHCFLRNMAVGCLATLALGSAPFPIAVAAAAESPDAVFSFPSEQSGFRRQSSDNSELTGIYARADYLKKIGSKDISVKVDIIHLLEMSPVEHFAIRQANLKNRYPNLVLKQQGEYKMKNLPPRSGYSGSFESGNAQETEALGVWTFDLGDWDVYIRAQYPLVNKAKAESEIRKLLSGINWQLLQKTPAQSKID